LIEEHVQNQLAEDMLNEETQKTNLEDNKIAEATLTVSKIILVRDNHLTSLTIIPPFVK